MKTSPGAQPKQGVFRRQWVPWITFFAAAALVLGLGILTTVPTLMKSFEHVEAAETGRRAAQVYRAFTAELRELAISDLDYATWDDSQQFVRDGNQHFIDSNLVRQNFMGLHVDLIWIVDKDGREIYSGFADRSGTAVQTPAPREYLDGLRRFLPPPHSTDFPPMNALVATSHGLVAVSAQEIQRTDLTEPSGATMLFARFIEASDIERVSDTSQLPVNITYLTGPNSERTHLPSPVRAWLDSSDLSQQTFALADNNRQITGYALVRDVDSRPIALFSTQSDRDIFALGRTTTWLMLGVIVAMFVAFSVAVIWLILRLHRSFVAQTSVEQRYRNVAAQLPQAIVLLDGSTMEIIEANETALLALQCTHDRVNRYRAQDIFPDLAAELQPASRLEHPRRTFDSSNSCALR